MQFMFMVCDQLDDPDEPSPEDLAADRRFAVWNSEVQRRGGALSGVRLRPGDEATTIRVRDGEVVRTPGPFSNSNEVMGGFDVIECDDYEDALALATLHPCARDGAVEVRPVWV
jgi:hypothetical protein